MINLVPRTFSLAWGKPSQGKGSGNEVGYMMDVLCLLHVVYYNRYMGDYMVPHHELYAQITVNL